MGRAVHASFFVVTKVPKRYILYVRASKGLDGVFETGEASRCNTLIANLKLNANENLALGA